MDRDAATGDSFDADPGGQITHMHEPAAASMPFKKWDRVVVVGRHPWATYAGEVIGPWPDESLGGYLVALDNGINIRAEEGELRGHLGR